MSLYSQQTIVKGSVKDAVSFQPILNVAISLEETNLSTLTDTQGEFVFASNIPLGEQILKIYKSGYIIKRFPIIVNEGKVVDITDMTLERDLSQSQDLFTITLCHGPGSFLTTTLDDQEFLYKGLRIEVFSLNFLIAVYKVFEI